MKDNKEYSRLLSTKEWKNKRLLILRRDHFKCTCCSKTEVTLYVHHKYYNNYPNGKMINPWDYPDEALATLCKECHRYIHRTTRIIVRYIPYNKTV